MTLLTFISALILVSPEAPEPSEPCSLEGSVTVTNEKGEEEAPAFAEVYIANASLGSPGARSRHTMIQRNTQFEPRALVVQVGDTVDFRNEDSEPHEVHAERLVNTFDVKRENSKELTYSKLFLATGITDIGCRIHSKMSANILVVPNSFHTHVDKNGKWKISGLPKRELEMVVWEAGGRTVTQKLTGCASGPTHVSLGAKPPRRDVYGRIFE